MSTLPPTPVTCHRHITYCNFSVAQKLMWPCVYKIQAAWQLVYQNATRGPCQIKYVMQEAITSFYHNSQKAADYRYDNKLAMLFCFPIKLFHHHYYQQRFLRSAIDINRSVMAACIISNYYLPEKENASYCTLAMLLQLCCHDYEIRRFKVGISQGLGHVYIP